MNSKPNFEEMSRDELAERVQKLRAEFWNIIRSIDVEDLIFIDESG